MISQQTENRIWFLQLARAIACLIIVYMHWITFICNPNDVLQMIYLTPINDYPKLPIVASYLKLASHYLPSFFSELHFGLGLFFLISGFIIPYSMGKITPFEFLFRRIMRIYPTVIICVLMATLFILIARVMIGLTDQVITLKQIAGNALLLTQRLRVVYIEYGLWTLEIEIRFYLLCFFLAFFNGHRKALILLFMPYVVFYFSNHVIAPAYISFMLIGTCLFNWSESKWSGKKTFLTIAILMIINRYYLDQYFNNDIAANAYTNHLFVLICFFAMLLLNKKLPYSVVMDKIANVSYPLYLVHGVASYAIFFMSYQLFHRLSIAIIATTISIIVLSLVIHKFIERPSITISKQLIKMLKSRIALAKMESQKA